MPPSISLFRCFRKVLLIPLTMCRRNCPRVSRRNISTMQSAASGTPVRFHSIFWCCCPDSTRPMDRSQDRDKALLHFAFVVIAVYMVLDNVILISLGFRHARSASFPLTLRNWKPQAHRSILTCCFPQRNHDKHPNFPRFKVSRVRLPKCPAQNPTQSLSAAAHDVVSGSLWYRSVQRSSSNS